MSGTSAGNEIHVVFSCDANYVMPLTVAMCSTAEHCDRTRSLVFSVFQVGIGPELREMVERSLAMTGFPDARVEWSDAPMESLRDIRIVNPWLTAATLVRLLLAELLPGSVDKVLYLDCDLVVNDDVSKLWDTDLGDRSLMAARDTIGFVSNPDGGIPNYRELGIPPDAKYFNAGVLLMNLGKWRRCNTSRRVLDYMRDHRAIIKYEDQEALNAVLFDDWGELDFRWNWQIVWRGVRIGTHKPGWTPDRSQKKSIVHFITSEKPWVPGCDYPEKDLFFRQLDRTVWSGWRVPWHSEATFRALRPLSDARNAVGRLRRRWARRLSP